MMVVRSDKNRPRLPTTTAITHDKKNKRIMDDMIFLCR